MIGVPAGSAEARAAIGYLAELFRFPDWLSADELVGLHQRLAGSEGGAKERTELLSLVGLEEAADVRVGEMSKGMQQRLGSPRRWWGRRACCCSTSPRARWTRWGAGWCATSSGSCAAAGSGCS